jgi:hypothetical protein
MIEDKEQDILPTEEKIAVLKLCANKKHTYSDKSL